MYPWSLKKEIAVHLLFSLLFFLPFVLLHLLVGINIVLLYLGVLLGTFLPDIDHLIYTLFLRPSEITSQRVRAKIATKNFGSATELLFSTREERKNLIFHTILFQLLFVVFAFLIVTSTRSLFGRGLVISFLGGLFIDEVIDSYLHSDLTRWLRGLPMSLTSQQFSLYVGIQGIVIILLGYLF